MNLAPGTILGGCEIRSALAAGGMGEVYRAYDPRLDREVAIKVLPPAVTSDPDRLRRFEQEARAAAALNHPNILAIYQFGTNEQGIAYLITELLEGETLRERLHEGPLPLRKAIDYAVQIANGLAAPHEKGIVHRDLKPENLFITRDGRVKILDFGLAKLGQVQATANSNPTLTRVTEPGVVLGTVGYMSPEQVRGKTVDHRSDIFSFGAILYEMITGKQTFDRPSSPEIMAAILKEEPPPLSGIVPSVSPGLQRVVARCLEKSPEQRFQSASDLAFALKELSESTERSASDTHPLSARHTRIRPGYLLAALALLMVIAAVAYLAARPPLAPHVSNYVQLTHDGKPKRLFGIDGSRLILYTTTGDYIGLAEMSVAGGSLRKLPVLPTSLTPLNLSADGSEMLAIDAVGVPASGPLRAVPMIGGAPRPLADYSGDAAAWSPDGKRLAFAQGGDLYLGDRFGAPARKILSLPNSVFNNPIFSPDGLHLRFENQQRIDLPATIWEVGVDGSNPHAIFPTPESALDNDCCGSWTPNGKYFIFEKRGQIWAVPPKRLLAHSDPKPVQLTSSPILLSSYALSSDSKKLYVVGQTRMGQLIRYDQKSKRFAPFLGGISAEFTSLSPDGQWVAYTQFPQGNLWRSRIDGSEALQLTYDTEYALLPAWSPDSASIVFFEQPGGDPARMLIVSVKGGSVRALLPNDPKPQQDPRFSADGSKILFGGPAFMPEADLRILDLKTQQVTSLPNTSGYFSPRWSPDGRSIAALSADATKLALYDIESKTWRELVSGTVGWLSFSRDGQYLYFLGNGNQVSNYVARVRLKDGRVERLCEPADLPLEGRFGSSMTLAADDSPLVLRNVGTQDVYSLDFDAQ